MNIFGQINASMESVNQQKRSFFKQGWVRAIGLLAAFLLMNIIVGAVFAGVLLANHAEEIKSKTFNIQDALSGPLRSFVVLATTVIGFVLVWLFTKFFDKRSVYSLGFQWKGYASQAGVGFSLPFILLGIGTLILSSSKYLTWTDIHFDGTLFFINVVLMLLVAFGEELIFRGYVLNNLMQSQNRRVALLTSALLFATFHMGSPGANVLPLINVFLAGLVLGVNYSHTRNLWFGMAFHFAWNFFQGPVLGYKVSGKAFGSVLEQELQGPALLTGGSFGFEGSTLCTVLLLMTAILLEWLYVSKTEKVVSFE
jgi:membrane protease YdiL (CAAX protease family)